MKENESPSALLETAKKSMDVVVKEVAELYAITKAVNDELGEIIGKDAQECVAASAHDLETAAFWALKAQNTLNSIKLVDEDEQK